MSRVSPKTACSDAAHMTGSCFTATFDCTSSLLKKCLCIPTSCLCVHVDCVPDVCLFKGLFFHPIFCLIPIPDPTSWSSFPLVHDSCLTSLILIVDCLSVLSVCGQPGRGGDRLPAGVLPTHNALCSLLICLVPLFRRTERQGDGDDRSKSKVKQKGMLSPRYLMSGSSLYFRGME